MTASRCLDLTGVMSNGVSAVALTPSQRIALTPTPLLSSTGERAHSLLPAPRGRVPAEAGGAGDEGGSPHDPSPITFARNVHVATFEGQDLAFFRDEAVPPDAAVVDPEQVKRDGCLRRGCAHAVDV